jgi:hypothetical protein
MRLNHPGNWHDFELISGHQQVLMKYTLYFGSFIKIFRAPYTGMLNLSFALVGVFILVRNYLPRVPLRLRNLAALTFLALSLSMKQCYMLIMATSLGSMQALLLISFFLVLKNKDVKHKGKYLVIISIFAPFTFSMGLVIPIAQLVEFLYGLGTKTIPKNRMKQKITQTLVAQIGIVLACVLPFMLNDVNKEAGLKQPNLVKTFAQLIHSPINSLQFIFSEIGNIFVPSSRFEPLLPTIAGFLILVTCFFLIDKTKFKEICHGIFTNRNPMMVGIIFLLLVLVMRFDGTKSGILQASQPRYITGSFLFIFGIVMVVIEFPKKNLEDFSLKAFLLILTLCVLVSGIKSGNEWLQIQPKKTQKLATCLDHENSHESSVGGKCFYLGRKISNPVTDGSFGKELSTFARKRYKFN